MGKILIVNTGPTDREQFGQNPPDMGAEVREADARLARSISRRLDEYQLKAVYFVAVPGAAEMADVIADHFGLTAVGLPGLSDPEVLGWTGMEPDDAAIMDCSFSEAGPDVRLNLPFSRNIVQLRERIALSLDEIALRHKKERVAVVAHRTLTVIMVIHMLQMDSGRFRQIAQEHGAVNLFEVRFGVPSAILINDTCHLEGLI